MTACFHLGGSFLTQKEMEQRFHETNMEILEFWGARQPQFVEQGSREKGVREDLRSLYVNSPQVTGEGLGCICSGHKSITEMTLQRAQYWEKGMELLEYSRYSAETPEKSSLRNKSHVQTKKTKLK